MDKLAKIMNKHDKNIKFKNDLQQEKVAKEPLP
jgi:hypothetical protein